MRILLLTNMYPPHHFGGYELSCLDTVERLRMRGHTVTVLTTKLRVPGVSGPAEDASDVLRELSFYWDDHKLLSPPLRQRLAIERSNQEILKETVSATQPDVVSVWNMGAMSLGLLTSIIEKNIPIVYVICDDWLVYGPKLDAWSRLFTGRRWIAKIVRRLTGVPIAPLNIAEGGTFLFVSDIVRRTAGQASPEAAREGTVVYSGIERRLFPRQSGISSSRPWQWRILYAGRLDERKGIHVAIDALKYLPDEAIFEIIGRGDDRYRSALSDQATRLGVGNRVKFDYQDRNNLHTRYAAADVVVFPVLWSEPFGLVPLEAMACGTPVVATGTGGSGEYLRDGLNCLLSPAGDAQALATAIRRLASEETLRARIVDGGLITAEELDVDELASTLERWHQAAADRFARGRPPERPPPTRRLDPNLT